MFDGMTRRIVSLWFPRLASDRMLRACPVAGPYALTLQENNANRLYCLNEEAEREGLHVGMSYSDARAFCPRLQSGVANPQADQAFLLLLRRWATRYCPWVGLEGADGLVLDVTGSTHLMGGEAALLEDIRTRMARAGLHVHIGLADTRGAAWGLAHYGEGIAPAGAMKTTLESLPVAALRLDEKTCITLQRLGLRQIGDLLARPRAPLTRRFGPDLLKRLDEALGLQPEAITPLAEPPHYGVRLTLPEPIGLIDDVTAGTERLLVRLCDKLKTQACGARALALTLRRVDRESVQVRLRLARPMRDPARILALFERDLAKVEAGFGIDQLRLQAIAVEALPDRQDNSFSSGHKDQLDDLITRLGTRVGLENIQRFQPADSHIPEKSFFSAPVTHAQETRCWQRGRPRPLRLFPPSPISGQGHAPPRSFRWRGMRLTARKIIGPERIAPEWWVDDENWRSGLRDYWQVETAEGRRLWMFYTPQNPCWFVQGEFA